MMVPPGLERRILLARVALGWEAFWPGAWPILGVVGVWVLFSLLDGPALLPGWLHAALLAVFALTVLGLLARAIRRAAWPAEDAAERRLERASGLSHRPLAALRHQAEGGDEVSRALWARHQQRALAQLTRLRVGLPRPGLAARDPRALRAALLVGLVAGVFIAGDDLEGRLWRGLLPRLEAGSPPLPARIEAWITPPAYTGAAPIFLTLKGGTLHAPAGSRLNLSFSGPPGPAPELSGAVESRALRQLDSTNFSTEAALDHSGALTLAREGRPVAQWRLEVQQDAPPRASYPEPPARGQRGLAIRIPWRAVDDWGVVSLRFSARLMERPEAAPLEQDIPLPAGQPRDAQGVAQPDLSAHPWAGLAVRLRLVARDGAEQEGTSEEVELTLPERSFNHPVAQQLVAIRRDLSRNPLARDNARRGLEALAAQPDAFEQDTTTALGLRVARNRLFARIPGAIEEAQELMWDMALALEEGRDARTARALRDAEQALRESMEEAERQGDQNEQERTEVQRRIEELREAIRQHLEAMAERLQRENAEAMPENPRNRGPEQRELQRRTERMREATRENRMRDAQRELAELEEMLRNMEQGRPPRGENAERQQRRERGRQQVGVVQDMVRREGEMLDSAQRRAETAEQRERDARRNARPFGAPQTPGAAAPQATAPDPAADARRQRALRRALGELMQQFGDLTGEVPEPLGRADQAMREAQEALSGNQDARDAQNRAIRALQEGGRQMSQQLQRQFGRDPSDGEGEGEESDMAGNPAEGGQGDGTSRDQGDGRDPLGRRTREVGGNADQGSDTKVPDEAELLRSRQILEELRRRGAERDRPREELDYIERLMPRF
ncbi:DUF4175 domain-containing protein [Rhodovarius lipocyclicus]|uniref:DUF4175 domain-containing protein n=1 Tax=Rhodovarius lipocyclicus TaxID=268410 RepID=UPI00135C9154|nr:DUF4175 family protein [Rhodovarius lipocyclicus]